MMIMIRSIIRPEKVDAVLAALMDAGFPAVTKYSVAGRGKQRGIKIGDVTYDEIPKVMLMSVINEADIAQLSIDLSRRSVLFEMSLTVAGKLMSVTLLDFLR